jgi:hypothetical protein
VSTDSESIVDKIKDTLSEKKELAIIIGAALVLLIVLIVALVIVLLRGRRAREERPAAVELPESPAPTPEWQPAAAAPGMTVGEGADQGRTEVGAGGWQMGGESMPAYAPPPDTPAGQVADAAGGTRIIERAPKHLALLVDKRRSDRRYDLKGTTNIGRAADNQIVIEDSTVSRYHAWIKDQEGNFLVFDVGSANGTFVNDERVVEPRPLQTGDLVRFGVVELVFTKVF